MWLHDHGLYRGYLQLKLPLAIFSVGPYSRSSSNSGICCCAGSGGSGGTGGRCCRPEVFRCSSYGQKNHFHRWEAGCNPGAVVIVVESFVVPRVVVLVAVAALFQSAVLQAL